MHCHRPSRQQSETRENGSLSPCHPQFCSYTWEKEGLISWMMRSYSISINMLLKAFDLMYGSCGYNRIPCGVVHIQPKTITCDL